MYNKKLFQIPPCYLCRNAKNINNSFDIFFGNSSNMKDFLEAKSDSVLREMLFVLPNGKRVRVALAKIYRETCGWMETSYYFI